MKGLSQRFSHVRMWFTFLGFNIFAFSLQAQPSGGPYGPIMKTYELPKAKTIYYVSPEGVPDAPGTSIEQPTTIESAISRVTTGDAIILRGGIYRTGDLILNQGIVMQPYADERPILKGTLTATEGTPLRGGGVWRIPWTRLFPSKPLDWWRRDREGVRTPLHRFNNDMVFVDGKPLLSVGWEGEVTKDSYYIDYENKQVYIGVDPAQHLVEITAWSGAIIRTSGEVHGKTNDRKGPVIRGITFTQYAWRAIEIEGKRSFGPTEEPTDEPLGLSDPATYGKEVIGTTLENVTISHCSRVAGFFRGDGLGIRNSLFSDTSTEGVYIIGSSDVLLERNIFRRNNVEGLTGYYPAAVKIFNQSHRVTCRDNLVIDNKDSNGIWYDVGNRDGVFVNNWVQDCINGFFFEISDGALCAGNVFVNCINGIYALNSANVRAWHNTFVNCAAKFERTNRQPTGDLFGWHSATGPGVNERDGHVFASNLLVSDWFADPLLQVSQTGDLCGKLTQPQLAFVDGNVYVRNQDALNKPLIRWSPVEGKNCAAEFSTLTGFQKLNAEFEANGIELASDIRSIFKNPELSRFQLIRRIETAAKLPLPSVVQQALNRKKDRTPGAYPFGY